MWDRVNLRIITWWVIGWVMWGIGCMLEGRNKIWIIHADLIIILASFLLHVCVACIHTLRRSLILISIFIQVMHSSYFEIAVILIFKYVIFTY